MLSGTIPNGIHLYHHPTKAPPGVMPECERRSVWMVRTTYDVTARTTYLCDVHGRAFLVNLASVADAW